MQLNQALHQEISELLADDTATTVILSVIQSKGISPQDAQATLDNVTQLRNKAMEASRARMAGGHQPPPQAHELRPANPFIDALQRQKAAAVELTEIPAMPAGQIPHINTENHDLVFPLGDRTGRLVFTSDQPRIVMIDGFLSDAECDAILAAAPTTDRSSAVDTQTGESVVHPARTSSGTFFARGQIEVIRVVEERIARVMHWPLNHGEGIQVLRYEVGQEYTPHYDYFDPRQPGSAKLIEKSGNRKGTVIMYLEEPIKGGSTHFPDAGGLRVYPHKGSCVFFSYPTPTHDTQTRHAGAPVIEGVKWIATKWLRDRPF